VAQQVLLPETVRPLGLRAVEQALLCLGAAQFQVVQRVLVGFEADHLHDSGAAFGFFGGGKTCGLAIAPLRCERDLLQTGEQKGIEVSGLFDQSEVAVSTIFAIEVDRCVVSSFRAGKETENCTILTCSLRYETGGQSSRFGGWEKPCLP